VLISLIGILLTIFLIIGIHESGHFFIARALGIKVLRFSIGFGKTLFRWHDKKGTEYVFAAIPLGGYVKMLDENEGTVKEEERHLAYNRQPAYKKLAVVIAGPLANLLFAFLLYWLLFMVGFTSIVPIIGSVTPHSIAANAGLKPQQEIIRVDNTPTTSWMSIAIRILTHTGETDQIHISTVPFNHNTATPDQYFLDLRSWHMDELKPDPLTSLGISPYFPVVLPKNILRYNQYGPITALSHALQNTYDFTYMNFIVLGKLFTGKVSLKSIGGPISIFANAGAALNQGITAFLSFLAFISISIGVINILPIPGLDGGHILFQLIELITRRPVSLKMQNLLYRLGFIILILVIVQAVTNDILRL